MGEAIHLTAKERHDLIGAIRRAIPDENFKLIARIQPTGSIEETVNESKSALEVGADFLIVLVPGYFGPSLISQEGIVDYCIQEANRSVLPVIIYSNPATCNNVRVSIDSYKKLSKHPNIVGVKLTH